MRVYTPQSGLGIAPAVAAAAVTVIAPLASKLVGALFGPGEVAVLLDEAKAGNVVAWWRLKARAGSALPFTQQGITAPALTSLEREALIAAMGPAAAQPANVSSFARDIPRLQVWTSMRDGWGQALEAESARLLAGASAAAAGGGPALAGIGPGILLAGGVGFILYSLMRR